MNLRGCWKVMDDDRGRLITNHQMTGHNWNPNLRVLFPLSDDHTSCYAPSIVGTTQ